MSQLPPSIDAEEQPQDPSRRRLLGGLAVAGAAMAVGGAPTLAATSDKAVAGSNTPLDAALRKHIRRVVVIYAENRSFNNLFANFPGVEKPLSALKPVDYQQRDRDGSL
ncbi:MAG: twin-arginine translocation signal domain-containing protein, partial [Dyella sp.]|nr:twin-arginine translocation signal domain-containing protein [Dyella sp.]